MLCIPHLTPATPLSPCTWLPQMTYSCRPGEVVTGLQVAWEAGPVAPFTNLATGECRGKAWLGAEWICSQGCLVQVHGLPQVLH